MNKAAICLISIMLFCTIAEAAPRAQGNLFGLSRHFTDVQFRKLPPVGYESYGREKEELSLFYSAAAFAQDAPATKCDTYAASDQDRYRKAQGVPVEKVEPALAIPACETAVRQYPNSGRLAYQLGRSYYAAKNFQAAARYIRKTT
jgi:hypothetical protein